MTGRKLWSITLCVFVLVCSLHSQSQSQSTSQALDETIKSLENFQLDFQKLIDDSLKRQLQLQTLENQVKESQRQQNEAMMISQELSSALDKSETKCRLWKNACLISTTIAVTTTVITGVLLYRQNKILEEMK